MITGPAFMFALCGWHFHSDGYLPIVVSADRRNWAARSGLSSFSAASAYLVNSACRGWKEGEGNG